MASDDNSIGAPVKRKYDAAFSNAFSIDVLPPKQIRGDTTPMKNELWNEEGYKITGTIVSLDGSFVLGRFQMEWLQKYKSINLADWRLCWLDDLIASRYPRKYRQDATEWLYVGSHGNDVNRHKNLGKNVYHYWPATPSMTVGR